MIPMLLRVVVPVLRPVLGPVLFIALASTTLGVQAAPAAASAAPKLVVVMVVDGLPAEQVQRYRQQFGPGGFKRLLEQGAWYGNAHQAHGITVTAVGHSAVLTGAYPYQHGIIGNNWIDPDTGKSIYCTEDTRYTYLNEKTAPDDGTSPANLRVPTLGDELRYAHGNRSKVVTVSGKDRGAILLAGKTGTAYMYMESSGNFATSSFYMAEHPDWVKRFQAGKPQDRYVGKTWQPLLKAEAYADDSADELARDRDGKQANFPFTYGKAGAAPDAAYYKSLKPGPYLDELTLEFARAAVLGENLGRNPAGVPDLLGVSLSAHDYVNHAYGPESKMSHDHLQRLDRMLADFFTFLDQRVGLDNVVVVMTADHGFSNTPEFSRTRHLDADKVDSEKLFAALNAHLADKFRIEKLVRATSLPNIYLDYSAADLRNIRRDDIDAVAARFLLTQPGVAQVYSREQMENGVAGATRMDLLMKRAWQRQRSGDLMVVLKPYWLFGSGAGASHGTPYAYDTNVPLMIMGPRWIRPGAYSQYAEVVDLAPTLAHLLRVRPPAGAEGRVLTETLR